MIYIFSQEVEYTTERVMDWLDSFGYSTTRFNGEDFEKKNKVFFSLSNNNSSQISFNKILPVKKNNVGWYRRFGKPSLTKKFSELDLSCEATDAIFSTVKKDRIILKNFILEELDIREWITHPQLASMNKLNILKLATKCGFKIPSTIICSSKDELKKFRDLYSDIIVKSISEVPFLSKGKYFHRYLTHKITLEEMELIPEEFVPTCFQEMIHKEYEIRVFYLDGQCYSMAIFSQNDKSTQVDFRNYNMKRPNRTVPYRLPSEISKKVNILMEEVGLNCGSIDIIKAINGDYIFLEINPVGQFGMVSKPCNYYLEKKVAESLIKKSEFYAKK